MQDFINRVNQPPLSVFNKKISPGDLPHEIISEWQSPSNIALVKYWGKKEGQMPSNPSLSMTLNKAVTLTAVHATRTDVPGIRVEVNRDPCHPFIPRLLNLISWLAKEIPFLENYSFQVTTSNTFPHSAGIASSASGISAFTLCLLSIILKVTGKDITDDEFFKAASYISRMGSGSACRSVHGGFSIWGEIPAFPGSSDLFAIPLNERVHPELRKLHDAILIVSSSPKNISSSSGHNLMKSHPLANARFIQAGNNIREILGAMESGDIEKIAAITENEALTLHSLIMTSAGGPILLEPRSLEVINKIQKARRNGLPLFFTLDAGPNVHVLYPGHECKPVENFIREELLSFCEDGRVIFDQCGTGPVEILNEPNPAA